jgi:outer membrane protein OmpA-like peptidoglycan-associated protein
LSFEIGAFGQYNSFDKNLNIDNTPTIGGRAALYVLKNLALEGDIQYGKTDWTNGATTKSLTLSPFAGRVVYGIPLNDQWKFLIGAGYQNNVYKGRFENVNGFLAGNEYEDAFTGLVGVKYCMNDKWNLRFDVPVFDYNPSPNFTGSATALDGKSTNYGFRAGVGTMLRGECAGAKFDWSLAVSPGSSTKKPGERQALTWNAKDMKDKAILQPKIRNFRWTSSNPAVATVDQSGNVTAVAPGNAEIKLCGMVSKIERCASHNATVRKPDWSVTVTGGGTRMVGESMSLSASAVDEDRKPVTGTWAWTSSNPGVATVDANGNVRCVSGGSATITATLRANDGDSRSGTANVTCNAPPPPPPKAILVVQLTDVHFGFNLATLTKSGRDTLNWVIKQLTTDPGSSWAVSVEGHTDPYGSEAYNEKLSDRRATTVLNYLTKRPGKVAVDRVQKAAFGERCLLLDDDHDRPAKSKREHQENRRVEIWNLNGSALPSGCRPASDYQNR